MMISRIIKKGRHFRSILIAMLLLFLIVAIGVLGFIIIEGYSLSDAFFMTIITMSTVGFSEVHPLSDLGRVFTSGLIIFSFGIFGYTVTSFTKLIIDGVFRNYYIDNKVKKRISKLKSHVIVCGYGRNGKQAMIELVEHKEQVVIVEKDALLIEKLREETDYLFIHGDSTQDEVLEQALVESAKALITTLPNDSDNLYVVLTAREMNPGIRIISRASDDNSDKKLKRAGADNVIMPDKVGGQQMAKLVAQPDIIEFLDYIMLQSHQGVSLEEVPCENIADYFVDRTIRELDVRNASGANIIGLRNANGNYVINPSPDVVLAAKDKLFVIGTPEQILKLKNILYRNL